MAIDVEIDITCDICGYYRRHYSVAAANEEFSKVIVFPAVGEGGGRELIVCKDCGVKGETEKEKTA